MTRLSEVGPWPWPHDTRLPRARTLPGLLSEIAAQQPRADAIADEQNRATYQELESAVRRVATVLAGFELGADPRVALLAPNSIQWLVIAFGALRRGAQLHAFNTWVRTYDLERLLTASQAQVLIVTPRFGTVDLLHELIPLLPEMLRERPGAWRSERFPNLRHVVVTDEDASCPGAWNWLELLRAAPEQPDDLSDPTAVATVLYTSGTTERPKAVPLIHRDLVENGFAIGERMRLSKLDRVWLGSPLFWSYGIANAAMATMTHGACLVTRRRFDAVSAAATLAAERCTAAYLLPTMVETLCASSVREEVQSLDNLRTGLTIGGPDILGKIVTELGISGVCNVYGSTEVYGNCCVTSHDLDVTDKLRTQGPPLPGVQIRIVDVDTGQVLPLGDPGEIQVRGRVTPGYLDAPELNASAFTVDGWFRTGDTGRLRVDGQLEFIGRHSEMIKTSGINVSPAEVEAFLRRHPAIQDAAVVGAPDEIKGQVVVAFVKTVRPISEEEVLDFCRGSIAGYMVPSRVAMVDDLPMTSTGKLARRMLRDNAQALVSRRAEVSRDG